MEPFLALLDQIDQLTPFLNVLEKIYSDIKFPTDLVYSMAQKFGFDPFKRYILWDCKNNSQDAMAKYAGYASVDDIKPILLTGTQLDMCRTIVTEAVADYSWYRYTVCIFNILKQCSNYKSDKSVFIMKYIYIVNDQNLQEKFLNTAMQRKKINHLVALSNKLCHWLGPQASSYKPITILYDFLINKVIAKRPKMVVPDPDNMSLKVRKPCKCDDCKEFQKWMKNPQETVLKTSVNEEFSRLIEYAKQQKQRPHYRQYIGDFGVIFNLENGLVATKDVNAIRERAAKRVNKIAQMDEFLRWHGQV